MARRIHLQALAHLRSVLDPSPQFSRRADRGGRMRTERTKLGSVGEHHARLILERKGMTFVESNWRAPSGEIDLDHARRRITRHGRSQGPSRRSAPAAAEESISRAKAGDCWRPASGTWPSIRSTRSGHGGLIWSLSPLMGATSSPACAHIEDAVVAGWPILP